MSVSPLQPVVPVTARERVVWEGLPGCGKALALATAARERDSLFVVIAADQAGAQRLMEELAFFNPPGSGLPLRSFPDWETLPYDRFSPYQDIVSERLATLVELRAMRAGILVVAVSTLMQRLPPAAYLHAHSLMLRAGQVLDTDNFRQELEHNGYRSVSQVMEHGDVAVRGSIIDIYPMGADTPFRLDLLDNEIDSIRTFDAETQRSLQQMRELRVLPAREVPLTAAAVDLFRSNWRQRFAGNPGNNPVYNDVSNGIAPAGIEYYLPLFYDHTSGLKDYFPANPTMVPDEGVYAAAQAFHELAQTRYEQGQHDSERPLLAPAELIYSPPQLFELLAPYPQIHLGATGLDSGAVKTVRYHAAAPQKYPVNARAQDPLALLRAFMQEFDGRMLLVAESLGRRETMLELFQAEKTRPSPCRDWDEFRAGNTRFGLTVAPLERGVTLARTGIAIISETQLFGERVQQRRLRKKARHLTDSIVNNLTELSIGAPVVHEEHGVGRYQGLVTLTVNELDTEFICLEYDQGDKLYVPVTALDRVSRFVGADAEQAPLHRLGSGHWLKAKQKALKRVYDVAAELLALHARRAAQQGHEFRVDNNAYQAFAQDFPFEETPGQAEAIAKVLEDMRAQTPMDRLICGDSGFGKTEVAMRAAFIAVENHKQVAVLAPTTLLAQQHYRNFSDRFADWPVRLAALSRFVSRKDQTAICADLNAGKIDIVIGTHKLLQDGLAFHNLGLIIIDEEHRFGVRQKEKLKSLRAQVDVLTLTATPIPRTLNLALSDLQSLSIIATPPSRRLPIKIFIREWDEVWLAEAMLRELKRGGQVYFVHNEISSIEKTANEVARLAPDARLRIAHGQMPEQQLEQVMLDFYHQRFNVLVCTTIIETGIDVPSANTIIINRADKFGLAQLYQLRGRVGRSHHRAYAYLVKPDRGAVSDSAARRFEAMAALEELGTGFTLATHDMEIRGVGEILGDEQSGHVQEVGFGLYMNLLERAVASLKAGRQPELDRPLDHGTEIDLHVPALIPADYLPDVHTRLVMYKRIAGADAERALWDLQEECIDRFGLLPEALRNLFRIAQLKQGAQALGIRKIDLAAKGGRIQFDENAEFDRVRLIKLIQAHPGRYKFAQGGKLSINHELADAAARFSFLEGFLGELAQP
ncbi:MAG: transcription-repair coupling factor [Gammaproteobacteria bacterium]|nr:transcription-repair coupling factor [Gammaproteobacteria bacterium]MCY4339248.1 transcription-repair coupling factor [Gammaproteobacteria bacterium]